MDPVQGVPTMSEKQSTKCLLVFVDGIEAKTDEGSGYWNKSSIARIKDIVNEGIFIDATGNSIQQLTRYYVAAGNISKLANVFKSKVSGDRTEDQIKTIVRDITQILESSQDQLCLYGSSNGAYVVRAVAGVLHHMGLLKHQSLSRFDELYDMALALYKARCEDDYRNGQKLQESLQSHTNEPPQIRFVGVFDTVKPTTFKSAHDLSMTKSIQHLRHAVAFNETHLNLSPELVEQPNITDLEGRSFIQAYFVGTHYDLVGGNQYDGLSLYPLQWMILESMKVGIQFEPPKLPSSGENTLSVVFPQYTGELPTVNGTDAIEWRLQMVNGIQVSMYDLQTTHGSGKLEDSSTHGVRLEAENSFISTSRRVFDNQGLIGWNSKAACGTIIHPSLFCILDRYPKFREYARFKSTKRELAKFDEDCIKATDTSLPPWLEGLQLSASGVKAFRILVCGKTGVGKSTLINKVFGVEMTEESKSYDQGVHDINKAFESPKNPGLLVHDSRGWQAGSDTELELIAQFLRHRAFQRDPAEALHVIWFCVDSDVSRIEEADKRTFETIAQYSHHVPVFVVGTKKDKLVAYHKVKLLESYMEKTNNFQEASRLANQEGDRLAEEQFGVLREQLSQIKHYKADGYCCVSKDDDAGVRKLLNETLGLIADERVRLFCVAAQVVDVDQKIDMAITECMRIGTHAIRTALVPLPFTGMIGTPTCSRLIVEHILQCFGFPKAAPEAVEEIMSRVVLHHLQAYLKVSMTQFLTVSAVAIGVSVPTMGIGTIIGVVGCVMAAPPAARMLLKCACDMILILERSFRYNGKWVSVKQIEDAAKYYKTATTTTFGGKVKLLQENVHDEIDRLVPLKKLTAGLKFNKLRTGVEEIIYNNRFGKQDADVQEEIKIAELGDTAIQQPAELEGSPSRLPELEGVVPAVEAPSATSPSTGSWPTHASTDKTAVSETDTAIAATPTTTSSKGLDISKQVEAKTTESSYLPELDGHLLSAGDLNTMQANIPKAKSDSSWRRRFSTKIGLKKSNTKS